MNDPASASAATPSTDVVLRVIIRGLRLNELTKTLIDAAVRSAVLRELATLDVAGDPQINVPKDDPTTRSVVMPGGAATNPHDRQILGLVATLK